MRILIATSPSVGHFVPIVPTAWAARAAGHDVLVAAAGPTVGACAEAGLPAFDAAPGLDLYRLILEQRQGPRIYAVASDLMADITVRVARQWCPDVVVATPLHATGPLVAGLLSVPLVRHGYGLSMGHKTSARVAQGAQAMFDRHGLHGPLPRPAAELDPCPPSMQRFPAEGAWRMRYIPYGGGGALPDWLLEPPARPRIAVSFGSLVPHVLGLGSLAAVVGAARELDVEMVLGLGGVDPGPLGELPPNVRAMSWAPLPALLSTSAAFVHHAGSGTSLSALAAGIPQLVLPQISDGFSNAETVGLRGVGIVGDAGTADAASVAEALGRLLEEGSSFRRAAGEVRAEIAGMPPPSDVMARFAELQCPSPLAGEVGRPRPGGGSG